MRKVQLGARTLLTERSLSTISMLAGSAAAGLTALHIASACISAARQRQRKSAAAVTNLPRVSVVRPLKGLEPFSHATIKTTFNLAPAAAEIFFCVESSSDPIIPLVERLIAAHPGVSARLLLGRDVISSNPKLNNLTKGWHAATYDWIVLADSNVLLPVDALSQLHAQTGRGVGIVCSPPVGSAPQGSVAQLECAFLNSYQARWQSSADAIGYGFAQGKVMYVERSVIEAGGGLAALAAEAAEDAAATKLARRRGLSVRLVDRFFEQPIPKRTFKDVWSRQLRWAQLRRSSFPIQFTAEIATGSLAPLALTAIACASANLPVAPALLIHLCIWYGVEHMLARAAGWPNTLMYGIVRDLMVPAIWLQAWFTRDFNWHGHDMRAERASRPAISAG
jgi:ceramide glucosyltransferase